MAQQMTEAQMMVQSVQQAAQAAAEAAKALREIGVPQRQSGFAEANKTVQCPREFGSVVSSEDQNGWADFSFSFRQWLCFADSNYTSDLAHVEEHCDTVVTFKAMKPRPGRASCMQFLRAYSKIDHCASSDRFLPTTVWRLGGSFTICLRPGPKPGAWRC